MGMFCPCRGVHRFVVKKGCVTKMSSHIEIRNKNHVVRYDSAVLEAEAVRTEPGQPWTITSRYHDGKSPHNQQVAVVLPSLSEVMQRKMVLMILRAL